MEMPKDLKRLDFQEYMSLNRLPPDASNPSVQKFVSRRPAWKPGNDLPWGKVKVKRDPSGTRTFGPGAFGGHVYAQAPLAAARVVEQEDENTPVSGKLGIHVSALPPPTPCLLTLPVHPRSLLKPWIV